MVWFAVLLFIAVGVVLIRARNDVAHGIAMFSGATSPPGCAVAVGIVFFILAALTVVLYQQGYIGTHL
jgi:hypothetical protein